MHGGFLSPPSKKRCTSAKFKDSWAEATLWPKANVINNPAALPSTWLQHVTEPVEEMKCLLCIQYNKVPRSGKPVWTHEPCTLFRLQSVRRHASSVMHNEAARQEIESQLANIDGGIAQAFEHCWEVEEKAVCAAISCVYFLAKEEIPHMTKYQPLLELIQHLGMPYLETLHKGGNATLTSHRTVDEFLRIAGEVVKLDIVNKI